MCGLGGHVGHVTQNILTLFRFPDSLRLYMKFGYNRPSGSQKESFEIVDGRLTESAILQTAPEPPAL